MRISRRAAMVAAGAAGALTLGAGVAMAATDDAGAGDDVRLSDVRGGMGGWGAMGGMHGRGGGWGDGDEWATGDCPGAGPLDVDGEATEADAASLARMAEEERMARDLYLELADAWDSRTFARISAAESHHLAAVQRLLDAYGLEDPGEGKAAGEYADAELQALYDELLAQGSESITGAYEAGAAVEEADIADLAAADPDSDAVAAVYDRLAAASERHLDVFEETLEAAAP